MGDWRNYAVTLQVVVVVEEGDDVNWDDIEAQVQDTGSYTLLAPWEADVIAVTVPSIDGSSDE